MYCQFKKYYESGFGADGENETHPLSVLTHTHNRQADTHPCAMLNLTITVMKGLPLN